jgi:glycosyltransferase involved in cell wall biosynthesis
MRLVASLNVRNELGRYLKLSVPALLEFCDEVRVQDDGSDDGSFEWLSEQEGVVVKRNTGLSWSEHEGVLHQSLFDFTMEACPTHVLAIDADEFVVDGQALREKLKAARGRTFTLRMCEVWKTDPWMIRTDGGWRAHEVGILYKAPTPQVSRRSSWRIWGRKMAGGRVPRVIRADQRRGRATSLGIDILHLGWAREEERVARHARYAELDGGNYHASEHIASILLPDSEIELESYPDPHIF